MRTILTILFSMCCISAISWASDWLGYETVSSAPASHLVSIFIVRHAETTRRGGHGPRGIARAERLAETLSDVQFTHVFSSHTERSKNIVDVLAKKNGLMTVQLPQPGSIIDGRTIVGDGTPAYIAIEPLSKALQALPSGSIAMVGANSDNIYAILNKMGVPVATKDPNTEERCKRGGGMCVPCLSNRCFPNAYNRIWHLVWDPVRKEPLSLMELRYGVGWIPPQDPDVR